MKKIILNALLLLSSSLFAQDIFWQSYVSVEHPLTGATDTAWFGIGDVPTGYNPYLDSLFYGDYDSLADVRILAFDSGNDTVSPYPMQVTHCGDLHRDIRPLRDVSPHYYRTERFEFMVWVDESNFELTQHARFNIDTTAFIQLLGQNVAPQWNLPQDSVSIRFSGIGVWDDFEFQGQIISIIEGEPPFYNADWESDSGFHCVLWPPPGYSSFNLPNARDFVFPLLNPPCPPSNDSIKVYRMSFLMYFDIYNGLSTSENTIETNTPYPNPTKGWLNGLGKHEKQLYNLQGQLLMTSQKEKIDLSPYPPGIYILKQHHQLQRIIKLL